MIMTDRSYFTHMEKEIFFHLLREHIWVIESRKNTTSSVEKKKNAWIMLTAQFNSQPGITERTTSELKKFWFNCKGKAKRLARKRADAAARAGDSSEETLGTSDRIPPSETTCNSEDANSQGSSQSFSEGQAKHANASGSDQLTPTQMADEEHKLKMEVLRHKLEMELQRMQHEAEYHVVLMEIALLKKKYWEKKLSLISNSE